MRELHHIGIPTTEPKANEQHMADAKLFLTDVADSPNRIEWLRFEEGSPMPDLLQTSTHLAYTVPDIQTAMAGKEILLDPFSPMEGLTVAFVIEEGIPVEFMEFAK